MKSLEKVKTMVCNEIDNIAKQNTLTPQLLQQLDLLTHTLKSIKSVEAMEGKTVEMSDKEKLEKIKELFG